MTLEQEKVFDDFINKMYDFAEILPNNELKDTFIAYNNALIKMLFFHLNPLINEYNENTEEQNRAIKEIRDFLKEIQKNKA